MSNDTLAVTTYPSSQGSILSFPNRGLWGNARYRGNCSGHVYKRIFEYVRPRVFTDPMVGSGTSVEVAREMGIESYGLDLHSGFNILEHSILKTVGKPSDLVLFHPPYHNIVAYSACVWGSEPHSADLSKTVNKIRASYRGGAREAVYLSMSVVEYKSLVAAPKTPILSNEAYVIDPLPRELTCCIPLTTFVFPPGAVLSAFFNNRRRRNRHPTKRL